MINRTQLTAEDIKSLLNIKGKEKGFEVTNIVINRTLNFDGAVSGILKGKVTGNVGIKGIENKKLIVEVLDLKLSSFGIFKANTNLLMKAISKIAKEHEVEVQGNKFLVQVDKIKEEMKMLETIIEDIYIENDHLNIVGENLNDYVIG
ncbi:hypothetical protein [Clostridium chauvoei]|uniref:Uncharacterized protein n=2 Tax=Clostridium chauvoei TaxID=46867 RepID=S6ET64_9CLOT|nr:hypothetical protein [Clostridium chauvoei]ATD55689.1 hypothetical protein BTM20_10780 [Clostridium chauvoei]ATD56634.1 hypothetical protein BTM21_02240 [Clostridium chauvoei]MBX7280068.1 hypothetical protein [Clostridium chauvoei]MBX7282552.1 hypothetical protein [Clostridium chauvoei]MBX7284959.1 hypothetical protein [Clostridium chauvoei]